MQCVPWDRFAKEGTSLGCWPRSLPGSSEPALLAPNVLGHVGERPQALPQRNRPAGEEYRQRTTDQEETHPLPEARRRKNGEDGPDHDEYDAQDPDEYEHRRP